MTTAKVFMTGRSKLFVYLKNSVLRVQKLKSFADHYAQIRQNFSSKGQIVGSNNLQLATYARANNWVMVTNNEKESLRVEGLQVENWVSKFL